MTQEDKELLLRDLSARLPYETMFYSDRYGEECLISIDLEYNKVNELYSLEEVKPYLRPMSSMTDDERKEYNDIVKNTIDFYVCPKSEEICFFAIPIDWLNSHHFDYRGLIEKDLAIEVTKENNPYCK